MGLSGSRVEYERDGNELAKRFLLNVKIGPAMNQSPGFNIPSDNFYHSLQEQNDGKSAIGRNCDLISFSALLSAREARSELAQQAFRGLPSREAKETDSGMVMDLGRAKEMD